MLTSTYYDGKQYKKDEVYSVDKETKIRWIKNGIAESEKSEQTESIDYNSMEDEQLALIAAEKEIDVTDKTKRQVINALRKYDGTA